MVGLPSAEARVDILRVRARRTPLADDVDLEAVALSAACDGFSGADLAALVREAAMAALQEVPPGGERPVVQKAHFDQAAAKVRPSVERGAAAGARKLLLGGE